MNPRSKSSAKSLQKRGHVSSRDDRTTDQGNLPVQRKIGASEQTYKTPLAIDLNAARDFLALLDPIAKRFHFRVVPEAEGATGHARNITGSFDKVASDLIEANQAGCAVYVATQAMKGDTASSANLKRLRCGWIDLDARQGQKLPKQWGMLPPQIIVESSPGSCHCWWLFSDTPTRDNWAGVQRSLVKRSKSDPNGATNVAKLLRVPGFLHLKGEPHLVRVVHSSPVRYGSGEMAEVYAPVQPTRRKQPSRSSKSTGPVDVVVLRSALDFLADVPNPRVRGSTTFSDDYDAWWRFGVAIHRAMGARGFDLWDAWSSRSRFYPGRQVSRAKWETFTNADRDDGVTVGSIFFTAKRHGWSHARELTRAQLARALEKFRGSQKQVHA